MSNMRISTLAMSGLLMAAGSLANSPALERPKQKPTPTQDGKPAYNKSREKARNLRKEKP